MRCRPAYAIGFLVAACDPKPKPRPKPTSGPAQEAIRNVENPPPRRVEVSPGVPGVPAGRLGEMVRPLAHPDNDIERLPLTEPVAGGPGATSLGMNFGESGLSPGPLVHLYRRDIQASAPRSEPQSEWTRFDAERTAVGTSFAVALDTEEGHLGALTRDEVTLMGARWPAVAWLVRGPYGVRAMACASIVAPAGSQVGDPAILIRVRARSTGEKTARCAPVVSQFDVAPVLRSLWFETWPAGGH